MKYIKLFEDYDNNDPKCVEFSDILQELEKNIRVCPSVKNIATKVSSLVDTFNLYGFEKSADIKKELLLIQQELEKSYNMNDEQYLTKDSKGLKNAPTSLIKRVINLI
jgi:hypothetical protein